MYEDSRSADKSGLGGNLVALSASSRKEKLFKIGNLSFTIST